MKYLAAILFCLISLSAFSATLTDSDSKLVFTILAKTLDSSDKSVDCGMGTCQIDGKLSCVLTGNSIGNQKIVCYLFSQGDNILINKNGSRVIFKIISSSVENSTDCGMGRCEMSAQLSCVMNGNRVGDRSYSCEAEAGLFPNN